MIEVVVGCHYLTAELSLHISLMSLRCSSILSSTGLPVSTMCTLLHLAQGILYTTPSRLSEMRGNSVLLYWKEDSVDAMAFQSMA